MARWLAALLLSVCVVSAFLAHWSLLDGAPRNSLRLFLDNQADRPFAYRILAPALVRAVDAALPAPAQGFLADRVAPRFHARYVEPLRTIFESLIPGISARADADWADARYRRSYVLMVMLMLASFTAAMLLIRRAACLLGASAFRADSVMLLYALITPTLFLKGGYFYDFTEQLGAAALICCVLQARWRLALLMLLLMQANKETALLMVAFLAPYAWRTLRWRMLAPAALALFLCVLLLLWERWTYAGLPGQPTEWHLGGNLSFWSSGSSWRATEDFHQVGVALPRTTFLYFALLALATGWWRRGATLPAASLAFGVLAVLLLCMGFEDEFRNLSLAMPLLVLLMAEVRPGKRPATAGISS